MNDPHSGAPQALPLALTQFGFTADLMTAFGMVAQSGDIPARVIAVHRNRLVVMTASGELSAMIDRSLATAEPMDRPATGDWIVLRSGAAGGTSLVRILLPRRTAFIRGAAGNKTVPQVVAANIDRVLIVTALPHDLNERRLERYLALAWESGALPSVVLTKCDLVPNVDAYIATVRAIASGVEVIAVSATSEDGIIQLVETIEPASTIALLGSSGVGKSTLVNRIAGESVMRTATVDADGRGRHTTTHRELLRLPNGMLVIDTPGMRELQLWSADAGLDQVFDDIANLSECCRFADCGHSAEPGCAVAAAVASGALPHERLESWRKLVRESARAQLQSDAVAASAERAKLRSMMRAVRAHVPFKRK